MGRLSLNKKYITNIRASVSGSDAHIFLGGSNNTISIFLNSAELTGNNNFALADSILIYDINVNAFLTYFLRGDGVTWRKAGGVTAENNTIIPNNSIIVLQSVSTKTFTMQGTNLVQKYTGLGRTTIKKQNLSILIPFQIEIDVYPNNRYIFKSATTNLLGIVFNPSLFNAPYQDILNIYTPNGEQLSFYFDGSEWIYSDFSPNANNYIIPNNSIIEITTDNITSVPVGGGAIIQKYNSGKINLFKSSIAPAPSLIATPLGIGFNVYSGNSESPGMPQTISYLGNPLDRIGYILNFLTNTNHYWTFTIANGYKIYFALDSGGYSPSNIDSSIAIRSGSTWVESNILSQQNFGQNQQGQYILSSAHPYAAGTYTLKITNSTATSVNYTIRFIVNAV